MKDFVSFHLMVLDLISIKLLASIAVAAYFELSQMFSFAMFACYERLVLIFYR